MNQTIRSISIMAVLAVILVAGAPAQQANADKAVDPVCGMSVVKANAKATFDYKGTTYYFCSVGCKEAFAREPEKYLKAQQKAGEAKTPSPMGGMSHMHMDQAPGAGGEAMSGCPMMARGMMAHQMPMPGHMGRAGRAMMPSGLGRLFKLYGDKIEVAVENTKDGAVLKVASKDPEVAKAIQVHMAEHIAMMKKSKEAAANAPGAEACANCPMKEIKK